jgi:hypothetical protein
MPSQPPAQISAKERMARFFGPAADEIAARWQGEPVSGQARVMEQRINDLFEEADAVGMIKDVQCKTSLCRLRVDFELVKHDVETNRRLRGALGADGWLKRGDEGDLLAFIPSEFEPLRGLR